MLPEKVKLPETVTETKANELNALFAPMTKLMAEYEDEFNEITSGPISPAVVVKAKELRLKYVKVRTGTAKVHKGAKAYHLAAGKVVDNFKSTQLFAGGSNEEKLKEIETFFIRREETKIEVIRSERMDLLLAENIGYEPDALGHMEDELFQALLTLTRNKRLDAIQAEEDARLAKKKKDEDYLAQVKKDAAAKAVEDERERVKQEADDKAARDAKIASQRMLDEEGEAGLGPNTADECAVEWGAEQLQAEAKESIDSSPETYEDECEESQEVGIKAKDRNVQLAQELNVHGINIVTCGECGCVNLHRSKDEEISCQDCGMVSEPCDFPDLFY